MAIIVAIKSKLHHCWKLKSDLQSGESIRKSAPAAISIVSRSHSKSLEYDYENQVLLGWACP